MKKVTALAFMVIGSIITIATAYAVNSAKTFPDVDYDDYYGDALNVMVNKGVISGYADGNFGPSNPVTRAQLVTILERYDREVRTMRELVCFDLDENELPSLMQEKFSQLCGTPVVTDP